MDGDGHSDRVQTNGRVVWVHADDGSCIGRFSPSGIDIHYTGTVQMETGKQCLFCREGANPFAKHPRRAQWRLFVEKMRELHGIEIPFDTLTEFEDA